MGRTKNIENGTKYTVVLPEKDIEMLKELVDGNMALSVNAAVREAVEEYIVRTKKELYLNGLKDAVKDSAFIKRTDGSMDFYQEADDEAGEMKDEW